MLKNSPSQHTETNSEDLLSHRTEQTILQIVSFLDLKSLETFQLTNRRIRQLFVTSLWTNLSIVTFSPHSHQIEKSSHEMFRRQYFQKHPEELIGFQNRMREKRLRERRRQQDIEKEERMQLKNAILKRRFTIQRYIKIHFHSEKIEKIMRIILAIFLFACAIFSGYYKTHAGSCSNQDGNCSEESCEKKFDKKLFQMIFLPGIFAVFLLYQVKYREMHSEKNLAFQALKSVLKMIIIIGALIYYHKIYQMLLFNSECNGFSSEIEEIGSEFWTMKISYGKTTFLVVAMTFLYYAALLIFNLCLESYAIYTCFSPVKRSSLPSKA